MLELRATIELNTPALGGGAEPRTSDRYFGLRPSAVRGALRAWFRAAVGAELWPGRGASAGAQKQLDAQMVEELRRLEARVFGSTTLRSSVDVAPPRGGRVESWTPQPKVGTGLGYLGYGVFSAQESPPQRLVTRPGTPIELRFWVRPFTPRDAHGKPDNPLMPETIGRVVAASVWLWCAFGGVGARWRRGFGSLRLTSLRWGRGDALTAVPGFSGLTELPETHDAHLAGIQRGRIQVQTAVMALVAEAKIGTSLVGNDAPRPHPNMRTLWGIKTLSALAPTASDPLVALEAAGTLLRNFRSSLERETPLPDYHTVKHSIRDRRVATAVGRAAFGLPLGFFFRSLGSRKTRFTPQLGDSASKGERLDRVPSPLLIRVHAVRGASRSIGFGVTLVNLAGRDTTPLLGCELQQSQPGGVVPAPGSEILDEFIDWAVAESTRKPVMQAKNGRRRRGR